jgi:hypothetical protein
MSPIWGNTCICNLHKSMQSCDQPQEHKCHLYEETPVCVICINQCFQTKNSLRGNCIFKLSYIYFINIYTLIIGYDYTVSKQNHYTKTQGVNDCATHHTQVTKRNLNLQPHTTTCINFLPSLCIVHQLIPHFNMTFPAHTTVVQEHRYSIIILWLHIGRCATSWVWGITGSLCCATNRCKSLREAKVLHFWPQFKYSPTHLQYLWGKLSLQTVLTLVNINFILRVHCKITVKSLLNQFLEWYYSHEIKVFNTWSMCKMSLLHFTVYYQL